MQVMAGAEGFEPPNASTKSQGRFNPPAEYKVKMWIDKNVPDTLAN